MHPFAAGSIRTMVAGVSGRTTFAAALWLIAWWVLHMRWKARVMSRKTAYGVTRALIAIELLLIFPPLWKLVS